MKFIRGAILDRIAVLADEMLRRGVPPEVVQPIRDWLNSQRVR